MNEYTSKITVHTAWMTVHAARITTVKHATKSTSLSEKMVTQRKDDSEVHERHYIAYTGRMIIGTGRTTNPTATLTKHAARVTVSTATLIPTHLRWKLKLRSCAGSSAQIPNTLHPWAQVPHSLHHLLPIALPYLCVLTVDGDANHNQHAIIFQEMKGGFRNVRLFCDRWTSASEEETRKGGTAIGRRKQARNTAAEHLLFFFFSCAYPSAFFGHACEKNRTRHLLRALPGGNYHRRDGQRKEEKRERKFRSALRCAVAGGEERRNRHLCTPDQRFRLSGPRNPTVRRF